MTSFWLFVSGLLIGKVLMFLTMLFLFAKSNTELRQRIEELEGMLLNIIPDILIERLTTPGDSYQDLQDELECELRPTYGTVRRAISLLGPHPAQPRGEGKGG